MAKQSPIPLHARCMMHMHGTAGPGWTARQGPQGMTLVLALFGLSSVRPTVNVSGLGLVIGSVSRNDVGVTWFRGIPYAEQPVGSLRFQPPKPHGPWQAPLNATQFGNYCFQHGALPAPQAMSEACLFLNVATPRASLSTARRALLPVMVWIHGGAYVSGASNEYDADALVSAANESIVVVTLNYRLGVFGFLGSKEVSHAAADGSSGNFGIADQRAAMAWVQAHIVDFGGDPRHVTIFGESAGGNSIINHLAQPASYALYEHAVIESGAYNSGACTMKAAQAAFDAVLGAAGCAGVACLVVLDAAKLLSAGHTATGPVPPDTLRGGLHTPWGPVVDGVALTMAPTDAIAAGHYNSAARVLLGSNRDEMAFFILRDAKLYPPTMGESHFDRLVTSYGYSPSELQAIKHIYANASSGYPYPHERGAYSPWWWAYMRTATDTVPGLGPCAVRWLSRMLLRGGTPAVFAYLFAHPTQADACGGCVPGVGPGSVVVPHASEIPYVFGDHAKLTPGAEAALAAPVARYWSNFARSGDPNQGAGVHVGWPLYAADSDRILRLDVAGAVEVPKEVDGGIAVQSGLRRDACDFFDSRVHAARATGARQFAWQPI